MIDIDMVIYTAGAFLIAAITTGFIAWGFKTGQFHNNEHLKSKPLEEDDEE